MLMWMKGNSRNLKTKKDDKYPLHNGVKGDLIGLICHYHLTVIDWLSDHVLLGPSVCVPHQTNLK